MSGLVAALQRAVSRPELREAAARLRAAGGPRLAAAEAWTRAHPRGGGALALAVVLAAGLALRGGRGGPGDAAVAEVREGPFRVAVVEAGTIQALRSVSYASTIQSNQAKIVALAPEGKLVQKGDLLILFDSAPFEEEIRRSQAQLQQAQADLEKAKQEYELVAIRNSEELAAARQKVERAQLELADTESGKGKLREEEADAAVANAEREQRKAESALEDLRPLLAEGFITRQELERAEQAVEKAREETTLARTRRDSLARFGRPLELSQARSDSRLAAETLTQLQGAATHRLEGQKAAISAAESRIQEAASRLAQAKQQLSRTEVRADVPGIVVYRTVFFGSEQRKPQVGDQVWANQPLLILPDVSKMVVETRVRETDVHKVERNQKVKVRVEAYPDLSLSGEVTLVGTLAQEERERRGTKWFSVTVQIAESDPRLRPGMTARVEIEVEGREKALSVPLDAVFEKDGAHVVYVLDGGPPTARHVALGPANADFVVVEKGLARGERVALRDPERPAAGGSEGAGE